MNSTYKKECNIGVCKLSGAAARTGDLKKGKQ